MALAFYQFTALIKTDVAGRNAIANQALTVNISGGGLATIYSDAAGTTPIVQPGAQTDSDGNFGFYAESGGYDIVSGGRTETVNIRDTDDLIGYEPTVASLKSRPVVVGDVVRVGERANGIFEAKTGLVENGFDIIKSTYDPLVFFKLQLSGRVSVKMFGAVGNGIASDQNAFQTAMDVTHLNKVNLHVEAGTYLVTGLTIPGNVDGMGIDDRDKGWRMTGQGIGEPFVTANTGGTNIVSVTDAPVLKDIVGTPISSNGTVEIDNIRFDGTSTAGIPVVFFESMYGLSSFHNCSIYQRGAGDGLRATYAAGLHIYEVWCMNKDFATYGLGSLRVGIGFDFPVEFDGGLLTVDKCSSRGWRDPYIIGGGIEVNYSATLTRSESSVCYNGVHLKAGARSTKVSDHYFEGGEDGIGIINEGNYNTIFQNLIFPGFSIGIQDIDTTILGSVILANTIGMGNYVNAIGIDVTSSAAFGGNNKTVNYNTVAYTSGTLGVKGIRINGTDPRISVYNNAFDPRGTWTGAGSIKIEDNSTNGIYGITTGSDGAVDFPVLSKGEVIFHQHLADLVDADIIGNILTVPPGNSFTVQAVGASPATDVLALDAGKNGTRILYIETINANVAFKQAARLTMAGGVTFTGPGVLVLKVTNIGGLSYAQEVTRTVF